MTAARVRCRNAISPSRSRARAWEREVASRARIVPLCNAMSTTSRLRRAASEVPLVTVWEPHSSRLFAASQVVFFQVDKGKALFCAFPPPIKSMGRREQRLAAGVLYLRRPNLLDRLTTLSGIGT